MPKRRVELVVEDAGNCPLLKAGEVWLIHGRELSGAAGLKFCGWGVCYTYARVREILRHLSLEAPLPAEELRCEVCQGTFRLRDPDVRSSTFDGPAAEALRRAGLASGTAVFRKLARTMPFLFRLPKELAAELLSASVVRQHPDGEVILAQGALTDSVYFIGDGQVELIRHAQGHDESVVTLPAGNCFGETAVFSGAPMEMEARARGRATTFALRQSELTRLMMHRPALSCEFSKLLADRLVTSHMAFANDSAHGIHGNLAVISLLDLVQVLAQSRRSGTLGVKYEAQQCRLGFRNGDLTYAECGAALGEDAFFQVVGWPAGEFAFEDTLPPTAGPGRVEGDIRRLMLDALRRLDELKAPPASPPAADETQRK